MDISQDDRLNAELMLTQVASKTQDALQQINLSHPGLTPEARHDLDVLRVKMEDILDKLLNMGANIG